MPEEWKKAAIVPLFKGKESKHECNNYRGIRMLSEAGKVYSRTLTERVVETTEEKVSEEQGGFRKGRGCVDQIFTLNMTERVVQITEEEVSEEQGGFMKGRGSVDQIFSLNVTVEEYLSKDRKLYAAST